MIDTAIYTETKLLEIMHTKMFLLAVIQMEQPDQHHKRDISIWEIEPENDEGYDRRKRCISIAVMDEEKGK